MNGPFTDFKKYQQGNAHALAYRENSNDIAAALFDGKGCHPLEATGRGSMMQCSLSDGTSVVLRICRRGGLLAHLLKEGFLLKNRPLMEFHIHHAVLERGIPAPPLLGVRWERRGLLYYGTLATAMLEGADLHTWLAANKKEEAATEQTLAACGAAIRLMHDRGVWHADLQLKNIFVTERGMFLLDFDKAQVYETLSDYKRAQNLLRLRRSFHKLGYPAAEYWHRLMSGYSDISIPKTLGAAYRVKAWFSDMIQGRRTTQV